MRNFRFLLDPTIKLLSVNGSRHGYGTDLTVGTAKALGERLAYPDPKQYCNENGVLPIHRMARSSALAPLLNLPMLALQLQIGSRIPPALRP